MSPKYTDDSKTPYMCIKRKKKRLRIECCPVPRDAGRNGKIERLRFNDLCKFLAFLTFSALGGKKENAPR